MKSKYFNILAVIAVLGLIIGCFGMADRLMYGHLHAGYGSYVPWGLWVVFYLFFVGLTAGAFLITIMTYVFGVTRLKNVGTLSAFTVLVALMCELIFVSLDLGHFGRIYRFLITPNFSSLMTWFVIFTNLMLIIYLLECFFLIREKLVLWSTENRSGKAFYRLLALGKTEYTASDRESDNRIVRLLSIISLPAGLLFYGTNGAFFAILQNRPIWNSAMTPLLFILAALLSGGALITFLIAVFHSDDEITRILGRAVFFILVVFLLMEFIQFFVGYKTGMTSILTSLDLIVTGPYAWTFWLVHLLIGSLIPLILFITGINNPKAIAWACLLIVVTFVSVRFNFLIPDLAVYKLEGLEQTFSHPRLRTHYTPSVNEWLVSVWIVSLGVLVFISGIRWLPILSSEKGGVNHV
jgi:molybdopterin-containing oxidoreductase family membrane subunit